MEEAGSVQVLESCFRQTVARQSRPVSITRDYYWWKLRRNILLSLRTHPKHPGWVVDVGSGHGITSCLAYDCLGPRFRYLAVDLNGMDLEVTRAAFRSRSIPGMALIADASLGLPVADGLASVVVCTEVLEHLPEPQRLLEEIRRILRPDGLAVFTTPNPSNPLVNLLGRGKTPPEEATQPGAGHGHVSVLTPAEWKKNFRAAGFTGLEVRRGALLFGHQSYEKSPLLVGLYVLLDALLDWLPGSTRVSENLCYTIHKSRVGRT